ncbi:MAG: phytoene desaturase family protein, partial [Bryobacteraceae bacterium]
MPVPASPPPVSIIGAGLGGLSAAIHLRLAGHPVEVFEKNRTTGGRANRLRLEGLPFDTGPTLLDYPSVFERLFQAAGRRLSDYVELVQIEPSLTYRWPDGEQLVLSTQRDRLIEELARFERGAARALERFFADAQQKYRIALEKLIPGNRDNPLRYFGALSPRELSRTALWRSMWGELGRFFRSPRIREALGCYAMYLGGSPFGLPGFFSMLPYGELSHGLWLPRGGIYALVQAVERLARELGIVIQTGTRVEGILLEASHVTGLRLAGGRTTPARLVVCNMDLPSALSGLLGAPGPRLAMSPAVVTWYWAVRRRPPGLGHHTIFLPQNYRAAFDQLQHGLGLPPDPAFYVAAPPARAIAPEGSSRDPLPVFVLVPVPVLSRLGSVDWPQAVTSLREHVLKRLEDSGTSILESDILVEQVWSPVQWQDNFALFDGSAFGAAHTLFQIGPFRPRNYSRQVRGLYFVGASTNPGTGLPMVVLGGKLVAERIARHVR